MLYESSLAPFFDLEQGGGALARKLSCDHLFAGGEFAQDKLLSSTFWLVLSISMPTKLPWSS
jgi:hypothetical protein